MQASSSRNFGCLMLSELWLPHVACFLDVTDGLLFLIMLMLLCLWSLLWLGYCCDCCRWLLWLVTRTVNGLGDWS